MQLDGSSFIKLSGVELAGRAFTLDCMAYVNSSSPGNARLFSIIDPTTGNHLASVRKSATQSNYIDAWANSYADCSQDNGYTSTSAVVGVNNRVHVALIYYPRYDYSVSRFYICVGGRVYAINTMNSPQYNRKAFDIVIGALPNGNQGLIGAIDEFRIYDGVGLWTNENGDNFTPPDASFYSTHIFYTDAIRMPSVPASKWRYDNIGEVDTLVNTTTAVQLTGLPTTQSRTGKAFYQTTQTKIFDVASSKEVWVKFDVFFDGVNRWRAYDISTGSGNITGVTAQVNGDISFFNRNTNVYQWSNWAKINSLQTVILHMIADSTNGLIEAYTDDGGLLYAYTGEVNNGANFANLYLQSGGAGTFFSNIVISNSPLWFDDCAIEQVTVDYLADAQREISRAETVIVDTERVVDKSWRYENYGTADLLKVTGNTVNNLSLDKSAIGMAFWQSGREGCFDIPATKELWAKFDLYYTGTAKWRVYDRKDSKDTGIARMNSTTSLVCYINGPLSVDVKPAGTITQGTRKTYLLHMVSDATDGYIELWIDGVKYYSDNFQAQGLIYKGNVNDGDYFSNFYMQSDNNSNLFSNVIISNRQIGLSENVWEIVEADAERSLYKSILLDFDLVRAVTINSIPVNFDADLCRVISASLLLDLDTERDVAITHDFSVDCERVLGGVLTLSIDAERKVANVVTVHFDKEWGYFSGTGLLLDTEREIVISVNFTVDALRKIPHVVTDIPTPQPPPPEPTPGVVPPAQDDAFLQSCTVSMSEQQLTDNITFTVVGSFGIQDAVDCQILDYVLRAIVEETTTRGMLTTCKCTVNIDALLYQQLAYSVPESKWEYTDEYKEYLRKQGGSIVTDPDYDEAKLKGVPSAPASAHITEIASKLGLGVSLHFADFISTMSTEVKSGTNYAGLLQELFGWTSRIPHLMINCYIRGNTLYVVQRGYEENTINLYGQKLTVHTINRKLVRATWGSDPWSKTEVKPYFNNWQDWIKEPLSEDSGGGGVSYNDEGLVEETTVEHGDETVVTHYSYETLENGQKFLHQEVATTYNKGVKVDEVTTTHDPVRSTQSHVYSTDADGVLGGVVTSSNNDDRITPWQNEHTDYSDGTVVSDGNSYYLLKRIVYHSDEGEMMKRTINGVSMIDTSFPVEGEAFLQFLTEQIVWLNRKIEETVTVDVYDYPHVIDFNDRIIFGGNVYYLRSNTFTKNEKIVNRQSLEFVRWY